MAYARFAVSHRAHFEVMYQPELYRRGDPEVRQARAGTAVLLYRTASPDTGQLAAGAAAWSLVHGLATLWLNGNLPPQLGNDPEDITRQVARYLTIPATPARRPNDQSMATHRDSEAALPQDHVSWIFTPHFPQVAIYDKWRCESSDR